ncbi:hypothetical protein F0562_030694 [Nyssa sinensis]|uniref:F-box domain-containing protein n=1 Tax=Nyssa sinensis TaxID=561372 RepID=A0A5J5B3E5_9ASTE|nr:hypothetical protein F0562_030694 [Nyssa sinensis]
MTSPKRRRTVTKWPENTSAAAAIAGNDDLLVEILIRLPAKSVLRFRSVSKRWLSLISDPRFSLIWSKPKSVSGLLLRRLSHSGIPKLEYIPFDNRNQSSVPFTSLDFVDDDPEGPSDMVFDKALFWNGSIHWLSRQSETSLCFDTDQECLKTIPMPPIEEGENERTSCYFGESGGHLHLAVLSGSHSALLNVFEMEPDYSKWFVKYRVDLDSVVASFPEMETNFRCHGIIASSLYFVFFMEKLKTSHPWLFTCPVRLYTII